MNRRAIINLAESVDMSSFELSGEMISYDIVGVFKLGENSLFMLDSHSYDTAIILDNPLAQEAYVYEIACRYISLKKEVLCFYRFKDDEFVKMLKEFSGKFEANITFYSNDSYLHTLSPIDIPVIYITGMGKKCNQLYLHLKISQILREKGIKTLDFSNSLYCPIYNMISLKNIYKSSYFDAIEIINKEISQKIVDQEADVIVISDTGGVLPYNITINNDYGFFNAVLKYACPYDYVFFNVYADEYDKTTIQSIVNQVLTTVNRTTLCLGLGHVATTMSIAGLSNNDEFIDIVQDEYNNLLLQLRGNSAFDVIDPLSADEIEKYLDKLIS